MNNIIYLSREERVLTPFTFYTEILEEIKKYYSEAFFEYNKAPIFSFENISKISPETLPLIISLGEYLKNYHKLPTTLLISNSLGSRELRFLKFLEDTGFFNIVGNRLINPDSQLFLTEKPRNIFNYNENLIGGFDYTKELIDIQRLCHFTTFDFQPPKEDSEKFDTQRTLMISDLKKVINDNLNLIKYNKETFKNFLINKDVKDNVEENKNDISNILSELVANSLIYSGNESVNYLWYSSKFKIILSISDIGKGLFESFNDKKNNEIQGYEVFEFTKTLKKINLNLNLSNNIKNDYFSIYESLYYSSLKFRSGLIDLICSIVSKDKGKFRIHNNTTQVIFSNSRHFIYFEKLYILRKKLINNYSDENIKRNIKIEIEEIFLDLFKITHSKISNDIYTPVRFFETTFPGVHIEAEILKTETL